MDGLQAAHALGREADRKFALTKTQVREPQAAIPASLIYAKNSRYAQSPSIYTSTLKETSATLAKRFQKLNVRSCILRHSTPCSAAVKQTMFLPGNPFLVRNWSQIAGLQQSKLCRFWPGLRPGIGHRLCRRRSSLRGTLAQSLVKRPSKRRWPLTGIIGADKGPVVQHPCRWRGRWQNDRASEPQGQKC